MSDGKKLAGKELYEASWEDAKKFAEQAAREDFEKAQIRGMYWQPTRELMRDLLNYQDYRLEELENKVTAAFIIGGVALCLTVMAWIFGG